MLDEIGLDVLDSDEIAPKEWFLVSPWMPWKCVARPSERFSTGDEVPQGGSIGKLRGRE